MRWLVRLLVVTVVAGLGLGPGALGTGSGEGAEDQRTEGLPARGEPWDLVFMTDSTGWGVPDLYAQRAEEALGVEVRVHDLTFGALSAARMREFLDLSLYAQQFAEAEIVVVFGNPRRSGIELPEPDIETCVLSASYDRPPPAPSDAADWAPYRETLGSVFERIWELRDGKPTVFRAVDMFTPLLGPWSEAGIRPECTREWEMMSDQVRAAAEAHGVRMVSVFDALNGPERDRDLVELGWVRSDGQHLNAEGAARMAEALAAAGFEPSAPPRPAR